MDWDTILQFAGTGGGLIVLLNWILALPYSKRKAVLDKDDVSRHMAERDNATIIELYDKNRDILERLAALEEMLFKVPRCRYYDMCPVRVGLREDKESLRHRRDRQPQADEKGFRYARSDTGRDHQDDDTPGQPP